VVAAVGLLGTLVLVALFVWLSTLGGRTRPLASGTAGGSPRQPVLSARRTPDVLSFVTRSSRLGAGLSSVRSALPRGSCLRVDWLGSTIVSESSGTPLVPGSTMKIVVGAVALEMLGSDTVFTTKVSATRNPDGSFADLYLVGSGDPLLVRREYVATEKYQTLHPTLLETLADSVVASGVTSLSGMVIGVDTILDGERFNADWPSSFHGVEAGPLGALMANDGAVVGQAVKPDDPALAAATEFAALLAARGVAVPGGTAHDVLPAGATVIASIDSASVSSVVQEMLVNSDNNTAEILLKQIGLKASGIGSTQAGIEAVNKTLAEWGVAGHTVRDGSGLSSLNRLTCDGLVSLLDRFDGALPPLLAVASETGTLREMFAGTPAEGRLLGKTGTLSGVKALAGYMPVDGEGSVRFALVMNRAGIDNRSSYRPLWNRLAEGLSGAQGTPRPSDLAP
jgi:D-alanyl-D-alanine carboxypeptidase/D-alanyl-D-alanine-endopeptidase (penicillin-binding protein 4)